MSEGSEGRRRVVSPVISAALVAATTNLVLGLVKLWGAWSSGSTALMADGYDSLADALISAVVLGGLIVARRPADQDHPYGHGKAESIASLAVALFVAAAGLQIGIEAWSRLRLPQSAPPGTVALGVAALSVAVKLLLASYHLRVGKANHSPALEANGRNFRADVVSSAGVFAGVLGARLGWPWLDPLAGLLIALLVLRTGLSVARRSVDELMDRVWDPDLVEQMVHAIRTVRGCRAVERIHPRSMGSYLVVDLEIGVPAHLTVREGDQVAHQVEQAIRDQCPQVAQVLVHVNPV
ncbi:cation diffusion facilitator family transporter [Limnochorda pilosa]|uniref:Cation transporter n=1 Tax=Limnochorda pilosa TaxID=1555112 RepID=A0A0K2SJ32_LIMPI|nr:cation diffusion facilitator family transporter [Limnochorda pilosa]BAS27037.1 cation transporter [Limnochorda pilosa]